MVRGEVQWDGTKKTIGTFTFYWGVVGFSFRGDQFYGGKGTNVVSANLMNMNGNAWDSDANNLGYLLRRMTGCDAVSR